MHYFPFWTIHLISLPFIISSITTYITIRNLGLRKLGALLPFVLCITNGFACIPIYSIYSICYWADLEMLLRCMLHLGQAFPNCSMQHNPSRRARTIFQANQEADLHARNSWLSLHFGINLEDDKFPVRFSHQIFKKPDMCWTGTDNW